MRVLDISRYNRATITRPVRTIEDMKTCPNHYHSFFTTNFGQLHLSLPVPGCLPLLLFILSDLQHPVGSQPSREFQEILLSVWSVSILV